MVNLMAKQDTLLRKLNREDARGLQRLPEVNVWLDRVENIEEIVNHLVSDRDVELQRVCGFCYGYGEKVFLTLRDVERLISDDPISRVSQWLEERGDYTHKLDFLNRTMVALKAKRDDLLRKEDGGQERLSEFQAWLDRVDTIENKVNALLSDRDVELQRVLFTLREVEELKREVFNENFVQSQTSEVPGMPIQRIIVGQETMLEKAWKHLMEDGVGIMGMYGMGGVGKTTLLTQINNKFCIDRCGFDFVIWVVVSNKLHVEKIQDEIAMIIGIGGEKWSQKDGRQKAVRLHNFLQKKRFVLFLDDIWEKVDLLEIGVPFPTRQNKCKVAFTTRSQDVCSRMEVEDPMEVQCLADKEALDLFQKKVGQRTLGCDPGIPHLAERVAKKCCGLPLALNVIGETMACKRTIQEWRNAIKLLESYATEFSGKDKKILRLLKFSYDNLEGEHVKSSLLYCALFPEDAKISKEQLINYWICEGIIDRSESIDEAKDMGYDIIGSLVRASLLLEENTELVYLHDVIREMALWIASDLGEQKEAFIVPSGVGLPKLPKVSNWKVVRRMSLLMRNRIEYLDGSPECLELTTLLLQRGHLYNISSGFFKSMPKLAVLDLRGNSSLFELPEGISNLVSLKYLNLSDTSISHLPKGLQELKKLIHLDLERTSWLDSIAGISSLHSLIVLKLEDSAFKWDLNTANANATKPHES